MADQFKDEEQPELQIEGYRRVAHPLISTSRYFDKLFEFRAILEQSETLFCVVQSVFKRSDG